MEFKRQRLLQQNNEVRQAFDKSYWLHRERQRIIHEAKNRLKNRHSKQEFKALEELLNGIYLRKDSKIAPETLDQIHQACGNFIQKKLDGIRIDSDNKLSTAVGAKEHKERIYKETILKRADEIDKILKDPVALQAIIKEGKISKEEIEKVVTELKAVVESDEILFEADKKVQTEATIRAIGKYAQLIYNFDKYYFYLRGLYSNKSLTNIWGEAFEKMLTVFNDVINEKSTQTTTSLINEVFSKDFKTLGSVSAHRGKLESDIFEWDENSEKKRVTLKKNVNSTIEDEILTIKSFDEKSGKVDVSFKLPEYKNSFSISAKSWSSFFNRHTFNDTSLFDAIIRTSNLDYTTAYGLVVGYYYPKGKLYDWVQAHEFAKTCILLDTVMGYSQKNNWVDTIIVENRGNTNHPVSVYSLEAILNQPLKAQERFINYDPKTLNLRYIPKKEWWLKKLQSQMHAIKVSVGSGILTLAK